MKFVLFALLFATVAVGVYGVPGVPGVPAITGLLNIPGVVRPLMGLPPKVVGLLTDGLTDTIKNIHDAWDTLDAATVKINKIVAILAAMLPPGAEDCKG